MKGNRGGEFERLNTRKGHSDRGPRQQPLERGSPEGDQGADAEGEAVVEQGGVAARQRAPGVLAGLLRVLLQVTQLEAAAQQQVQELRLQGVRGGGGNVRRKKEPVSRFYKAEAELLERRSFVWTGGGLRYSPLWSAWPGRGGSTAGRRRGPGCGR